MSDWTILPAVMGIGALTVSTELWGDSDEPIRPTAESVVTTSYPIIGWRVSHSDDTPPRPLLPIDVPVNCTVMLLLEDGRVLAPDSEYDSIKDMEEFWLLRAQDRWDREHLTPTDGNDRMGRMA